MLIQKAPDITCTVSKVCHRHASCHILGCQLHEGLLDHVAAAIQAAAVAVCGKAPLPHCVVVHCSACRLAGRVYRSYAQFDHRIRTEGPAVFADFADNRVIRTRVVPTGCEVEYLALPWRTVQEQLLLL